jgi:uncharacterized BrkB/YihY/UPF0761 family membrane protein
MVDRALPGILAWLPEQVRSATPTDVGRTLVRGGAVNEPIEPPSEPERVTDEDAPPKADMPRRRPHAWIARAQQFRADLEQRPRIGFLLRSIRRFGQIEGKHLSLVIAMNLFVSIIPLLILGYAFISAFNPHRSFGNVVVHAFHLTGTTAQTVENTFTTASSGKSTALSISIISLLITGFDVSATVQLAYARAFGVTPLSGLQKYLRGATWLGMLLAVSGGSLALRYLVIGRPVWVLILVIPTYLLLEFSFYIVTPRLLLDLPFAWRDLAPGAAVSTGAAILVSAVSSFQLHRWFSAYGKAYGGFGIGLGIIAYVGLIALFWVWVAAIMGVYWEGKAGSSAVAAMHKLSADLAGH